MKGAYIMTKQLVRKDIDNMVNILKVGGVAVGSLDIARVFGKQHKNVLSIIRKQISNINELSHGSEDSREIRKYFIENDYINSRGKSVPRFYVTRMGFDLVLLSMTGKKAFQYKLWFIEAFHKMQSHIARNKKIAYAHNENPVWLEFRKQGKEMHAELTQAIKKHFVDYRFEVELKDNDGKYYVTIQKLINKHENIVIPTGVRANRDTFDLRVLFKLEETEIKVAALINKHGEAGVHYKEIFKIIKRYLEE